MDISNGSTVTADSIDVSMNSLDLSPESSKNLFLHPLQASSTATAAALNLNASVGASFGFAEISANSTMIESDESSIAGTGTLVKGVRVPHNSPNDSRQDDDDADDEGSLGEEESKVRCEICGVDLFNSAFDESSSDNGVSDAAELSVEMSIMSISMSLCTPCKKKEGVKRSDTLKLAA